MEVTGWHSYGLLPELQEVHWSQKLHPLGKARQRTAVTLNPLFQASGVNKSRERKPSLNPTRPNWREPSSGWKKHKRQKPWLVTTSHPPSLTLREAQRQQRKTSQHEKTGRPIIWPPASTTPQFWAEAASQLALSNTRLLRFPVAASLWRCWGPKQESTAA